MDRHRKLLAHILMKSGDANVSFDGLCQLLRRLGFVERVRGAHHIFTHESQPEIINLQPRGALAKPYQVKQVRELVLAYGLSLEE